ncbi:MAG TPA: bifunctional 4-hydroxy-2-oxoglutarate aldolase/2-dehydro-3-deoxy-phosphogluconate aldolase [Mobilitalea sp.]|nr:bifunctional 4-hydroxy-2-oxoglutarate aldolase/2-dehydro-3-deoxy-phosphogluconate aldolase [Mobilitalea sp.]
MHEVLKKISLIGIVPVIKIDDVSKAVPLAKALCKGGMPVAEITFRTDQAESSIAIINKEVPEMLVGAGTILTVEQVDRAVQAGAKFIVSPGFNPNVVEYCVKMNIPIIPGCINPSDIERAISYGLDAVKFFPAEASGGIRMIKALSAPYDNMRFMPTGGIDTNNLNEYLSFSKVLACGGSWMVPENLLKEGNYNQITLLAKEAMANMLGFRMAHVGFNCENEEQADLAAQELSFLFDLGLSNGSSSIFAGNMFELMKSPYKGTHGHIAIKTNYIDRAVNFLTHKGYEFDETTAKKDDEGNLKAIYLKNEISGFGIHLLQ